MTILSFPAVVRCAGFAVLLLFCTSIHAQNITFNYLYKFEPTMVSEPPELGGLDIQYPDAARKNGVEGTARVSFTLGEDGRVRDALIVTDLPFGVGEAVRSGIQRLTFKQAMFGGKPVAMKATLEYVVTLAYEESDKDVSKPKIIEKPAAQYPQKYAAEKVKGKVAVSVLFLASGDVRVRGVSSTMPKEFDRSAMDAAKLIKFTAATHKKSKQAVSQTMVVEYDFKP